MKLPAHAWPCSPCGPWPFMTPTSACSAARNVGNVRYASWLGAAGRLAVKRARVADPKVYVTCRSDVTGLGTRLKSVGVSVGTIWSKSELAGRSERTVEGTEPASGSPSDPAAGAACSTTWRRLRKYMIEHRSSCL